jgi:serine/threonine-protein kinase
VEKIGEIAFHSGPRGRYVLLKRLSVTPHAAVYSGVDSLLARDIVVKIHRNARAHARQRALFESRIMARLKHPNIVPIYDMGEHVERTGEGPWLYSVIEQCEADLHAWVQQLESKGPVHWATIILRIIEVARGLAYLHDQGYIHGDVKPTNILIKNGIAVLADFGHAEKFGASIDDAGGTAGYVAPEVVFERDSTFASDVFSLAATTHVCLFAELPFSLPSGDHVSPKTATIASASKAGDGRIKPPEVRPRGLPDSVPRTLELALHPDPNQRLSLIGETVKQSSQNSTV